MFSQGLKTFKVTPRDIDNLWSKTASKNWINFHFLVHVLKVKLAQKIEPQSLQKNVKEDIDETKYDGHFENDSMSGKGTFYYPNGEKYVGNWENGFINGEGVLYASNGTVSYNGLWKK